MSSLGSSLRSMIVPTPREKPDFVEVDSLLHYTCPVCNDIFKDCVQLPCGHKTCGDPCVDQLFQNSSEDGQCPIQDEDCFVFPRTDVLPDYGTRREILKLKVYCKYKCHGCVQQLEWSKLAQHCTSCDFRPIECPNQSSGCEEVVLFNNTDDHVTNHCQFSPISCEYCSEHILRRDIKDHHDTTCSQIEIACKYNCDIAKMPREQMLQHYNSCPKKPAKCPYAGAGCSFEGKESEVREHEQNSIAEHMILNRNYTKAMERQNEEIQRELQVLKDEKVVFETQISEMKHSYENLVKQFEGFKKDSIEFQLRVVSTVEKVFAMEELLRTVPSKQTTDQLARELRSTKDNQEEIMRKLTELDRQGFVGGRTNEDNSSIEALRKQVQNLERQTAIQDIRLAELDLRFQILETASYDGVLIWKIMDYARRKNDAINGRTYSLFSQPFYTGRFGYKMCGRVYLNGDGMGKGSHISLFFVIMKGEHDALMPWPFQQNIQMSLLDQEDGRQTISDSFRPDTSSSSFQRPTSDMNTAVGCPLFCSHTKLENANRRYLKDDTIFIKIAVESSGLPHH